MASETPGLGAKQVSEVSVDKGNDTTINENMGYVAKKKQTFKSKCNAFTNFLYDKKTNKILGRTFISWIQILLFYIVFFSYLIGLLVLLITLFKLICIDNNAPYLTGTMNILRLSPALHVFPTHSKSTSTIVIDTANPPNYDNILKQHIYPLSNTTICNMYSNKPNNPYEPCPFNISALGPCVQPIKLLRDGYVCLFVTLNLIYGWIPDLASSTIYGPTLQCSAQDYKFTSTLVNDIEYYPNITKLGFFSQIFYPYINQQNYERPYVALKIKMEKGSWVGFKCELKNLNNFITSPLGDGALHFELFFK